MRQIDADALKSALWETWGYNSLVAEICEFVDKQPTVDAVPIEPLCDFLARNYEPMYDLDDIYDLKWPIDKDQQKEAWMKVLKRVQGGDGDG